MRVWYIGSALSFQVSEIGSIPITRSNLFPGRLMVGHLFLEQ